MNHTNTNQPLERIYLNTRCTLLYVILQLVKNVLFVITWPKKETSLSVILNFSEESILIMRCPLERFNRDRNKG